MRSRLPAEVLGQRHETGLPTSPDLPAAAKRAIPSRRDTSRSVAETSADEMELVLTVISGRDKKRRVRKKKVSSDTRSEKTTTSAGPKTFAEATVRPPSTAMRWWGGGRWKRRNNGKERSGSAHVAQGPSMLRRGTPTYPRFGLRSRRRARESATRHKTRRTRDHCPSAQEGAYRGFDPGDRGR
jgi:hypothetical protein